MATAALEGMFCLTRGAVAAVGICSIGIFGGGSGGGVCEGGGSGVCTGTAAFCPVPVCPMVALVARESLGAVEAVGICSIGIFGGGSGRGVSAGGGGVCTGTFSSAHIFCNCLNLASAASMHTLFR